MAQLENIEAIEKRLWNSADILRANGNFASNEAFLPSMGLIFLRHAFSRFLALKPEIEAKLPSRGGVKRVLTKEDFSGKGAIYLRDEARFDHLVNLTDADDRAQAIMNAMEMIEDDYESLAGVLPKREYQELGNDVLGTLLRTFNDASLKDMTGDVFGRIYEYFLTRFADQGAHDNGEFFTPISIVQMIVNVIEPDRGNVIDPASGSGGMFVQSAHFIEQMHRNPQDVATFYGMEKSTTTIRLAKMNLAVHGLEGKIAKAITYYEDPHEMVGKCDFVMANPPFNVDEVDASKVKNDPRLPFGLPGVNKTGHVSNGNYLWMSYFYSYLNEIGRAGFVMSSQASSAGGDEAKVRRKMIETGHVDAMIAIRSNFFYTRSVPCELWFFNKGKPKEMKGKVLMIDARNVFRKVTRKIYDFSPEQIQNLTAIIWLYRGERDRFLGLVENYLKESILAADATIEPLHAFYSAFVDISERACRDDNVVAACKQMGVDISKLDMIINETGRLLKVKRTSTAGIKGISVALEPLTETCHFLIRQIDHVIKLVEKHAKKQNGSRRGMNRMIRNADVSRKIAIEALRRVCYFHKHAIWLQDMFPDAELRDVEGLVKLVDHFQLQDDDWSLTPGRYVGVAPEQEDESFDFEKVLQGIHVELDGLNDEAALLATQIQNGFRELY